APRHAHAVSRNELRRSSLDPSECSVFSVQFSVFSTGVNRDGQSGSLNRTLNAEHRTLSAQLPLDHLQGVTQAGVHSYGGRHLVADVDHAVLAPGVLPVTIILPGGFVQEVGKG